MDQLIRPPLMLFVHHYLLHICRFLLQGHYLTHQFPSTAQALWHWRPLRDHLELVLRRDQVTIDVEIKVQTCLLKVSARLQRETHYVQKHADCAASRIRITNPIYTITGI